MNADKLRAAALSTTPTYIEDVFSTYLYTGNGSTQTITNGIDLAGEGGLVWLKPRSEVVGHTLFDVRGSFALFTESNSQSYDYGALYSRTSTGFTLGNNVRINRNATTYASWTFRKQPKFFDVVTYTGTGSPQNIAHSLGSVPGCIIVKCTSTSSEWWVYHKDATVYGLPPRFCATLLNSSAGTGQYSTAWNETAPTSTAFTVGTLSDINGSGQTYVAYLFAHDAGGFGESGTDNVISCGSYTGTGSAPGPTITLGYEPQWVLIKRTDIAGNNWICIDNMRSMSYSASYYLYPNTSDAEVTSGNPINPMATGFSPYSTGAALNASGGTYIYIAIRRGPMKTPTSGTSVFAPAVAGINGTPAFTTSFPVDLTWVRTRNADDGEWYWQDRLRGLRILRSPNTNAEATVGTSYQYYQNGFYGIGVWSNYSGWAFRRAPGFFDVVCYTGTGSNTTQTHNLGVAPELIIVKRRNTTAAWDTYSAALSNTEYLVVNTTAAKATGATRWNSTTPTSTVFSLGTSTTTNASGGTYVAYLFASCPGVSKVGSYTGTGASDQVINCGFTGGARFVMIKRTDGTSNWRVWDTARGIASGNDPSLDLNNTSAEETGFDQVDPDSSGFKVKANDFWNTSGANFIFLAIA